MNTDGILISDFDGTMTARDFFNITLERLPAECALWWERYEKGEIRHFDALANIFGALRCSRPEMDSIISEMEVEPGLKSACERLESANWKVVVASAGCGWYIEQILAAEGIEPELITNPGEFREEEGLLMRRPLESPWYDAETGVNKAAVVRDALSQTDKVAYAGDGRPDLAPLLLVAPRYRFARGWAAQELQRRAEPFVPFARWHEIAERLAAGENA